MTYEEAIHGMAESPAFRSILREIVEEAVREQFRANMRNLEITIRTPRHPPEEKPIMTTTEVARLLSLTKPTSVRTVRNYAKTGQLRPLRNSKPLTFLRKDVEDFVRGRR